MWWIHKASKWYLPSLSSDKPKILPVHIHAWSQGAGEDVFFMIRGGISVDWWMLDLAVMQHLLASKWAVSYVSVDGHEVASPRALPPSSSLFLLFLSVWHWMAERTARISCLQPHRVGSSELRCGVCRVPTARVWPAPARSTLQEKPMSGCSSPASHLKWNLLTLQGLSKFITRDY